MNRILLIVVIIVFGSTPSKAIGYMEGIVSLLLDESRIIVFEEKFSSQSEWEFTTDSLGYDPDGGMDAGALSVIRDQKLTVSAYENCGYASASAAREINNSIEVDNIQWKIKIERVYVEEASATLRVNYGSVGIALNLSNLPFDTLHSGVDNVTIVIDYRNGVLRVRANGKPMTASVSIDTNSDSNIEILTNASSADCHASAKVVVTFIQATAVFEN